MKDYLGDDAFPDDTWPDGDSRAATRRLVARKH